MRKILIAAVVILGFGVLGFGASAAEKTPEAPAQSWSYDGIFGAYDKAQLRRGYQVFSEICSSCHSLRYVAYRHLAGIGLTAAQIEKIAAEKKVPGEPDDEGEIKPRNAKPSDMVVPPFANANAARAANNGALPPDLTLMVLARNGGSDYLYALLTGYKEKPPKGVTIAEGLYYNAYFPGHRIAMMPPLSADGVEYPDKTKATVPQMARDVVAFLHWAADPYLEERKRMGIKVVLFLIFLTALLYAWKRKVWKDVH